MTRPIIHRPRRSRRARMQALVASFISIPPRYALLGPVLQEVVNYVTAGKGEERHGRGEDMEDQHGVRWARRGIEGQLYQISKKASEARGLPADRQRRELLSIAGECLVALVGVGLAENNAARVARKRKP